MANQIFAFDSENSLRNVAKASRMTLNMRSEVSGRPNGPRVDPGGADPQMVMFTIHSYDYQTGAAMCNVEYRPYLVKSVIGEISAYEQIEVHDPTGGLFNESEADLIGRWGWAVYMQPVAAINVYQPPVWICWGLLCPPG
ncbi:MAG: hypothetical protein V4719_00775 [Planctomycetota bacterium]